MNTAPDTFLITVTAGEFALKGEWVSRLFALRRELRQHDNDLVHRPGTGPMDQARRGRADNSASNFEECRQKCLDMNNLREGIENSGLSRCELWTRPEGIGATNGVPFVSCETNVQAPVFSLG